MIDVHELGKLTKPTYSELLGILKRYPELTEYGFGVYADQKLTPQERADYFCICRNALGSEGALENIRRACFWLTDMKNKPSVFRRTSSYGLKHLAAKDIGYTTNGQFIAGAIAAGYMVKRIDRSPNAALTPPRGKP